jgi:hypothetical protein
MLPPLLGQDSLLLDSRIECGARQVGQLGGDDDIAGTRLVQEPSNGLGAPAAGPACSVLHEAHRRDTLAIAVAQDAEFMVLHKTYGGIFPSRDRPDKTNSSHADEYAKNVGILWRIGRTPRRRTIGETSSAPLVQE